MKLSIIGTLTPDATIADTGDPVGTYNSQPYWSWSAGGHTWYLFFQPGFAGSQWVIGASPPAALYAASWIGGQGVPTGEYSPEIIASGVLTVAEVSPSPGTLVYTLQIHSGPDAGKYYVLRANV